MDRVARMADDARHGGEYLEKLHTLLHEDDRGFSTALFRLFAEFPAEIGLTLSQRYPASYVEMDPPRGVDPVSTLWGICRVLLAREKALGACTADPAHVGGQLLTDLDTALKVTRDLGILRTIKVYSTLADAVAAACVDDEVQDKGPAPQPGHLDPIGPLRLTAHQEAAVRPVLESWKRVRSAASRTVTLPRIPTYDRRWREIEQRELWSRCMVMAGAAGVGKSYSLVYLILRLMLEDPDLHHVCLTAYTHGAAQVLDGYFQSLLIGTLAPKLPAWAIQESTIEIDGSGGRPWPAWSFTIAGQRRHITRPKTLMSAYGALAQMDTATGRADRRPVSPWHLGVTDESSMNPRETTRALLANVTHPILFAGDPGQLPPVEDSNPSGEPDGFSLMCADGFEDRLVFANLMEAPNLRTDASQGGILALAHNFRKHVDLPPKFEAKEALGVDEQPLSYLQKMMVRAAADGGGVARASSNEALNKYVSTYWNEDHTGPRRSGLIVCGTHHTRSKMNDRVRQRLGFRGKLIAPGETMIVESSKRTIVGDDVAFANNEFFTIYDVLDENVPVEVQSAGAKTSFGAIPARDLGVVMCVRVVAETARGEYAEILIPHATLRVSPRVQKTWSRGYKKALDQLKAAARKELLSRWGTQERAASYAVCSLFHPQEVLSIPVLGEAPEVVTSREAPMRGTAMAGRVPHSAMNAAAEPRDTTPDGYVEKTWRSAGVPKGFKLTPEAALHYFHSQFNAFIPPVTTQGLSDKKSYYKKREAEAVLCMNAWKDLPVVFAHYGYCITGHASQGTQFENVYAFVEPPGLYHYQEADEKSAHRRLQEILRWFYVVTTRAQRRLYLIDALSIARYDRRAKVSHADVEPMEGLFD